MSFSLSRPLPPVGRTQRVRHDLGMKRERERETERERKQTREREASTLSWKGGLASLDRTAAFASLCAPAASDARPPTAARPTHSLRPPGAAKNPAELRALGGESGGSRVRLLRVHVQILHLCGLLPYVRTHERSLSPLSLSAFFLPSLSSPFPLPRRLALAGCAAYRRHEVLQQAEQRAQGGPRCALSHSFVCVSVCVCVCVSLSLSLSFS